MEGLNWLAIGVSSLVMFGIGGIWHSAIFGKLWTRIHHGKDTLDPIELKKSEVGLWKIMLAELIACILIVVGIACVIRAIPEYSALQNGLMVWAGFILPVVISTVIWGGDLKKWMVTKIAVTSASRLIGILAAAYILSMWK